MPGGQLTFSPMIQRSTSFWTPKAGMGLAYISIFAIWRLEANDTSMNGATTYVQRPQGRWAGALVPVQ